MNKKTKVSIICNTFNHEKYIRDALEGFVAQQTDFPFEVLIHDDASTDRTADIIREYEERYPDIINPIYQNENKYSLKIPISATYQYPRVKGEYVAFCEGDDYWTDPLKLQKQYDALESHPDIDICAHASVTISAVDGTVLRYNKRLQKNGVIPTETVIDGGGGYVASASLFYRKALLDNIPPFRQMYGLDYTLQVHGALRGGMYYLSDEMSVYREGVPNSATQRMRSDIKKKIANGNRVYQVLKQLDIDTNHKYHKLILKKRAINRLRQIYYYCAKIKNNIR